MQNGTAALKDSLAAAFKTKHLFTMWSKDHGPQYLPKGVENWSPHKIPVNSSFIHNWQNLEVTKYPLVGYYIYTLVYSDNKLLFGAEKKWDIKLLIQAVSLRVGVSPHLWLRWQQEEVLTLSCQELKVWMDRGPQGHQKLERPLNEPRAGAGRLRWSCRRSLPFSQVVWHLPHEFSFCCSRQLNLRFVWLQSHEKTWRNLKCVLSERSPSEKTNYTVYDAERAKLWRQYKDQRLPGSGGRGWMGRAQRMFRAVTVLCMTSKRQVPIEWQHQEWILR